jgi:hypothetical protein
MKDLGEAVQEAVEAAQLGQLIEPENQEELELEAVLLEKAALEEVLQEAAQEEAVQQEAAQEEAVQQEAVQEEAPGLVPLQEEQLEQALLAEPEQEARSRLEAPLQGEAHRVQQEDTKMIMIIESLGEL